MQVPVSRVPQIPAVSIITGLSNVTLESMERDNKRNCGPHLKKQST